MAIQTLQRSPAAPWRLCWLWEFPDQPAPPFGALTIQGIQPGPLLFSKNPEISYSIFASLLFGVPIMVAIGLLGARVWMKATSIPKNMLAAAVTGICVLGAFSHSNSMYLVWVMMACGIVGYFLWIGGQIFPGCCPNNAC